MLFPADFEAKIGFDQIRELLKGFCLSESGKSEVESIGFSADHGEITTRLAQTEEFRQILLSGEPFPLQSYTGPVPLLNRLRIENTFPEPEELAEFRHFLNVYLDVAAFFTGERKRNYPELAGLIQSSGQPGAGTPKSSRVLGTSSKGDFTPKSSRVLGTSSKGDLFPSLPGRGGEGLSGIRDLISAILDDKGQIRDSASQELTRIRREINRLQSGILKRMNQIFAGVRKSGWTDEEAEVTVRDGRLVIPFRSAHKRKIPGVVHDESATGQTVYVEPVELFEMNNEIRELHHAERRETVRILTGVADRIRPLIPELTEVNGRLGEVDCIRAKASFAERVGGVLCHHLREEPWIGWNQAVHPLLYLSHKKTGRPVVPLDIFLDPARRVLVISGPNAGGKSICLKSIGLIQYMLQCGLLPPAREDSEFGLFRQIMIDIGDEQSLEHDLSTYTSKLLNMKYFLEHLDDCSLFLIDEMGSGTDPSIGGAIAEAALVSMAATGAYGVVTTHYSNLKLLADTPKSVFASLRSQGDLLPPLQGRAGEGLVAPKPPSGGFLPSPGGEGPGEGLILNAAMLFDTRTMKPLYKLKTGKPGSSFALEIARSVGFPERELERASGLIGVSQLDFESQLQELEAEKEEVARKSKEFHVADEFIGELIANYEKRLAEVENSRKAILEKAREEARQLLQDSNRLIERTIREIRESQAEKERTKAARSVIKDAQESSSSPTAIRPSQEERCSPFALRPSQEDNNVQRKTKSEQRTAKSEQRTATSDQRKANGSYSEFIRTRQEAFSLTLDLRGKRAEEVFQELQRFIDDAVVLSIKEVRILHGKGTGALREVTRNYLRTRKEVRGFQDEHVERGGAGITMVTLE